MGVSGAGKTAIGRSLSARLGWEFVDGDDLHPAANREKMAAGLPLDDADRAPWLRSIRELIDRHERQGASLIIACSALKNSYRELLLGDTHTTRLVYLRGSRSLIESRLRARRGHFFDPALLDSQFETLEEPDGAIVVDIDGEIDDVTDAVLDALGVADSSGSEEEREQ